LVRSAIISDTLASKLIYTLLLLIFPLRSSFPQEKDYKAIFGKDWIKAEVFISENEGWMKGMSSRYHISFAVAASVIFPELVRYSALRDKIETTLLKTLYVNLGNEYANFSIGPFQMKPTFAEFICSKAPEIGGSLGKEFRKKGPPEETTEFRKSIVSDLERPESEFVYLASFIRICIRSYDLEEADIEKMVTIISTAYNCGPGKSLSEIKDMASRRFFNTRLYKTENYCYSDISLYWYRSHFGNLTH